MIRVILDGQIWALIYIIYRKDHPIEKQTSSLTLLLHLGFFLPSNLYHGIRAKVLNLWMLLKTVRLLQSKENRGFLNPLL